MVQSPGLHVPLKEFRILIGNCELPVTVQMTILISKMVNDQDKFSFTDTGDISEFIALSEARSYNGSDTRILFRSTSSIARVPSRVLTPASCGRIRQRADSADGADAADGADKRDDLTRPRRNLL